MRELTRKNASLSLSLPKTHSSGEAAEKLELAIHWFVEPILLCNKLLLYCERRPEVGHLRRVPGADELRRRDSDDGEGCAIYFQRFSRNLRIRVELALPERMAQKNDRIGARSLVFFSGKSPANLRADSQSREIIFRDELALQVQRFAWFV